MHDLSRGTIAVTGGTGLIGSAVIWALNRRGLERILVADRLDRSEKWRHLVPLRFDDYLDADELIERLERRADAFGDLRTILHFGACSSTTETDAAYLLRNNYEYTKRLAEWSRVSGVRFVYASSAATYGDGSRGMDDRDEDVARGWFTAFPAPLESGVINYREAFRYAISVGYQGVICTEHYGGDGLSVSASNQAYLREKILPRSEGYHLGESRVAQIGPRRPGAVSRTSRP